MGTLNPRERNVSVLRPYGVWAVISPFNFPMALAAGPAGAALAAGNTVILKPSPQGSFSAAKLYECFRDAGLDPEVFHLLPGGDEVGAALVANPGVSGLTFTGSYAVGMSIYRQFAEFGYPKPVICEMGGKNPAIVSGRADLDVAADGVARSAFGLSGQKCSACSRVYAQRDVLEAFVAKLAERAGSLVVGDPTSRDAILGPVVSAESVARFERVVEHARSAGEVVTGGNVLRGAGALPDGYYVAPTVVTGLPDDDWILRDELFVPLVTVAPYDTLDDALTLANDTDLGLLLDGPRRGRQVPRRDPGRGRLREPGRGRHDRGLAGSAAVRRLEGLGHRRQGRRRPLLRAAVPAGTVKERGLVSELASEPVSTVRPRMRTPSASEVAA
jgi:1-pyrroline-5-carboxylate dehydrogenase